MDWARVRATGLGPAEESRVVSKSEYDILMVLTLVIGTGFVTWGPAPLESFFVEIAIWAVASTIYLLT